MMRAPNYSFNIPSVHDDTTLECRIYHPKTDAKKGAIFAHPYAPLGGSFDDEVVLGVVKLLLNHGYIIGTFNFRGAGNSKGRTSWSSKPELGDYISFIGFIVYYLNELQQHSSYSKPRVSSSEESLGENLMLLLGGYSYGGLLTVQLPPLKEILSRFNHAAIGSAEAEIRLRADSISKQQRQALSRGRKYPSSLSPRSPGLVCGGEESEPGTRRVSRESRRSVEVLRRSVDRSRKKLGGKYASEEHLPDTPSKELAGSELRIPSVQFLIVSPLLPPIAWFIALSTPSLAHLAGTAHANKTEEYSRLSRNDSFCIFGDKDNFTSVKRLRKWSEQLQDMEGSRFRAQEVSATDHFWKTPSAADKLNHAIDEWLTAPSRE